MAAKINGSKCTGCGACVDVCPRKGLVPDTEVLGFKGTLVTETMLECL